MRERLRKRWDRIRASKANLVLFIVGCALLLLAILWRTAIAPALRVVATDFDLIYFYEGSMTYSPDVYAQGGSIKLITEPIVVERRIFSRLELSSPSFSAVEEDTVIRDGSTGREIASFKKVFFLNRRTCETALAWMSDESNAKMVYDFLNKKGKEESRAKLISIPRKKESKDIYTGYYLQFPFNTKKESYPYWSEFSKSTHPAKYVKTESIEGLKVYYFRVEYKSEKVSPASVQKELTGKELKEMAGNKGLNVSDSEIVNITYTADGKTELTVEPSSGTIVTMPNHEESISLEAKRKNGESIVSVPVSKIKYSLSKNSLSFAINFGKDERAKIRLQFAYIPLGLLCLAIFIILVGSFTVV